MSPRRLIPPRARAALVRLLCAACALPSFWLQACARAMPERHGYDRERGTWAPPRHKPRRTVAKPAADPPAARTQSAFPRPEESVPLPPAPGAPPPAEELPPESGGAAAPLPELDPEETEGLATYYASRFHGRRTASGERHDRDSLVAAHRTLPFGTRVRVTRVDDGSSVVVRVNDRGPHKRDRVIDLSRSAAEAIGLLGPGIAPVRLEVVP